MKLSKRLQCVANMIEKQATSSDHLADIGTDHGYLPCFLVKHKIITQAYACDVAKGPLATSIETIDMLGLHDQVIPLLGDGLSPILDKLVSIVSICGMGGFLMVDILKAHLDQLPHVHTLVLQANICEYSVRTYLCEHGWQIVDEAIVEDVHHLYEVITFQRTDKQVSYKALDYQFGPILRVKKPALFIKKWQREKKIRENILESIEDSHHPRYVETKQELLEIEAILNDN